MVQGLGRKLTWQDYTKVDEAHKPRDRDNKPVQFMAGTRVDIKWNWPKFEPSGGKLRVPSSFVIRLIVVKDTPNVGESSWVLDTWANQTPMPPVDELLDHEQLHYDIAAIAAATLDRQIAQLRGRTHDELKGAINALDLVVENLRKQVDNRYDSDKYIGAEHGRYKQAQAIWTGYVREAEKEKWSIEQLLYHPSDPNFTTVIKSKPWIMSCWPTGDDDRGM